MRMYGKICTFVSLKHNHLLWSRVLHDQTTERFPVRQRLSTCKWQWTSDEVQKRQQKKNGTKKTNSVVNRVKWKCLTELCDFRPALNVSVASIIFQRFTDNFIVMWILKVSSNNSERIAFFLSTPQTPYDCVIEKLNYSWMRGLYSNSGNQNINAKSFVFFSLLLL